MSIDIRPADLRDVVGSDLHKIGRSWVETAWGMHRWCSRAVFRREFLRAIWRELERSSTWVASHASNRSLILGWLCGDTERGMLHYVYVEREYRHCGICRALIQRFIDECGPDNLILTMYPASKSLRALGDIRPQAFGRAVKEETHDSGSERGRVLSAGPRGCRRDGAQAVDGQAGDDRRPQD